MMVTQADQVALVEMMARLYLAKVAPREAKDVSLEEFRLYLESQMDSEKVKDYESAIAYQQRRLEMLQRCEAALHRSIEALELFQELTRFARIVEHGDTAVEAG